MEYPCDAATRGLLLDANSEALWFARAEQVPEYMGAHPDGELVWRTVRTLLPKALSVPPALVHIDFWPGNVLWRDDRISAVVDWEEAAWGDPGIAVGYCRMELCLSGSEDAARVFLESYEAETGSPVANLGLWELAAAARPMFSPSGWITTPSAQERFRRFIADAVRRATG